MNIAFVLFPLVQCVVEWWRRASNVAINITGPCMYASATSKAGHIRATEAMERTDHHIFGDRKGVSFIAGKGENLSTADAEEQLADGEDLLKCFRPLLGSMRVFGCYFTRARPTAVVAPDSDTEVSERRRNGGRIYASVVCAIMWTNAVRMLSAFDRADKFGAVLLLKLAMICSGFLSAVLHTACFVACQTGNLDRIFREARLPNSDVGRYRRLAVIHTAVCWGLVMADIFIFVVPLFTVETKLSSSMAPFGIHVYVSGNTLILVQLMLTVVFIWASSIWVFFYSVNYTVRCEVFDCYVGWRALGVV